MTQVGLTKRQAGLPHLVAWLLCCATFPLIWVGGLVTTYDAGMAVPDWPGTYGYNMFLYPWQTWIAGPWDLFIEHGHRLLGASVGLIAIALVVTAWRYDGRRWMTWLAVACLGLVILQGLLGGQRVLLDDRRIAQVHGIVGPLFFSLCVVVVAATSRWWNEVAQTPVTPPLRWLVGCWLAWGLALGQLVLGAQLRHGIEYAPATVFRTAVVFHVVLAGLLFLQACGLAWAAGRTQPVQRLRTPGRLLLLLVGGQWLLGIATWSVKYGWPILLGRWLPQPAFIVQAEGMWQSLIVTMHVAVGSLILATAGLLVVRSTRLWVLSSQRPLAPASATALAQGSV